MPSVGGAKFCICTLNHAAQVVHDPERRLSRVCHVVNTAGSLLDRPRAVVYRIFHHHRNREWCVCVLGMCGETVIGIGRLLFCTSIGSFRTLKKAGSDYCMLRTRYVDTCCLSQCPCTHPSILLTCTIVSNHTPIIAGRLPTPKGCGRYKQPHSPFPSIPPLNPHIQSSFQLPYLGNMRATLYHISLTHHLVHSLHADRPRHTAV